MNGTGVGLMRGTVLWDWFIGPVRGTINGTG